MPPTHRSPGASLSLRRVSLLPFHHTALSRHLFIQAVQLVLKIGVQVHDPKQVAEKAILYNLLNRLKVRHDLATRL